MTHGIELQLPGDAPARAVFSEGSLRLWQGARLIVLNRGQAQRLAGFIVDELAAGGPAGDRENLPVTYFAALAQRLAIAMLQERHGKKTAMLDHELETIIRTIATGR